MGNIVSRLERISIAATADQRHTDKLMVTIYQPTEMNKILVEKINHLTATSVLIDNQP